MKTQFKRFSKSTISVLLAVCLLFSCMTVGIIATDAAKDDSEAVGWNTNSLKFHGQIKTDKSGYSSSWNDITMDGNGRDYYYFWAIVAKNTTVSFGFVDQWNQYLKGGTKENNSTNSTTGISRCYWSGLSMYGSDPSFTTPNSTYSKYIVVIQCWTSSWNARVDMIPYTDSTVKVHYQDQYGSYHKYLYAWQSFHGGSSYNATNVLTNYTNAVGDKHLNGAYGSVPIDTRAAEGVSGYTVDWNTHDLSYLDYPSNYGEFYLIMKDGSGKSKDLTINRSDVTGKSEIWVYNASNDNDTIIVTDRVALRTKINNSGIVTAYNGGINTVYTSASYATFKSAYEAAATKFSAYASTQSEINTAKTDLQNAYNGLKRAADPLDTPTISFANSTVTANPSGNATLNITNHSTISDKDSNVTYELYKGGTASSNKLTSGYTYSNGSFTIPAKYSNRGEYYVKAIHSSASYSDSAMSSKATLTVNRTQLTAPTVSVSKTDIAKGASITLTATDANTGKDTTQYNLYYYTSSLTVSDTYKLTSGTAKTLSPQSDTTYKVVTYPVSGTSNEYYTQSDATSATQIKVYSPEYKIAGDEGLIGSTAWTYAAAKDFTDYTSNGIFTFTTQAVSAGDHYFKLYDYSSYGYSGSGTQNSDTEVTIGDSNKYSITKNDSKASFKVNGSGIFVIYYDSVNKKIWVTQNTWAVSTVARVKTYNLSTGAYNAVANATSTHGTASPASINVEKGQSTTLTATAMTGYSFEGWYTNEACTTAVSGSYTSTSYSATPTANTTYYALFKQTEPQKVDISVANITGATITAKWNNQTKTNGESLTGVPVGASVTVTVTPNDNKYLISTTPSLSSSKFTVSTSTTNITATLGDKLSVTAKTNKSDRGTVSVSSSYVKPGDTVTVTVSPKNGVLKTLTYTYGTTTISLYPTTNSSLNATKLDVATVTAMMYDFFNKSGEALGAAVNDEAVGADSTYTFTMPSEPVTVNATFDAYSAESNWYYNGYDTSGNAVSGYHGKQMTEAMVGGEKFSYYEVSGRTGTDQLMTVSNGAASSGTRYVYFTASAEGGWSTDENHQYAYFYNTRGDAGNAWPGYKMTKYTTNDYGQNVYRVEIPTSSSPTGVIFNNASNAAHQTTSVTDLSKGGYYLLNTSHWDDSLQKTVHDWQSYDCTYPSAGYSTGTEYFYRDSTYNGDYTGDFNTKGFNNHYTASKEFAKPKDLGTNTGDYYINVLYPNTTYTINGVTKKTGSNPMIIWSAEPLAGDDETVKVYAKDGAIRAETFGSTYANIADTKIYAADGTTTVGTKQSGSITNQTYETYKVDKGETIVIKTTIGATDSSNLSNADALKAKYYVRGFCVNGEVSELLEPNDTGVYTLTYKVPEDYEGKNIEITPIYYLKDTSTNPIVTYRVTGFTDALKAVGSGKPGWGDTLYTYPFYGKLGGQNNAFGAYPGQPMVYYKGQYQMQIPQKSTAWDPSGQTAAAVNNTTVAGVTMSNGYWDSVHKTIMGYGDNSSSADHVQTYDYGDFYKIFNEKKPVDNIVFDFKYRTKKHNFENQPDASTTKSDLDTDYGTNGNGFELLTNFHGRTVDLFGTPLSGEQLNATPVYVVSIGGVDETNKKGVENIAGYYATEWMVYGSSNGSSYTRISAGGKDSIPPEVLVLNDDDDTSFSTTTYPSAVNTTAKPYKITDWKALYTALEAYRGKPVYISYEAADAQQAQGMYYTGTGGATRNDGRWLYSKNGENITSKIKIQYSNDNGKNYNDLNTTNPQVNGLSAYFTNDGVEGQMTYSTTIDPDKTFDFEAKTTNADYKFVGWFMEDGTKITTDNSSHTERSGSYTFVAKFMQVQGGQLILSHSADKGTISGTDYQGAGTAKISAVVKDGDEVVRTYDLSTSDITLDDKIIKSDSDYTIEVTLEATATGQDTLGTTVLANPSGQVSTYFNPASTTTEGKTKTIVLNSFTVKSLFSETTQSVKNIIYHSYFNQVKFHYQVTFQYKDRFGETKNYTRQGYLTTAQVANENYVDTSSSTKKLLPAFIQTIAPHVSNFGKTITWNFDTSGYAFAVSGNDYNVTATISATQTSTEKRNITFKLPYEHNDGIAVLNGNVGTAATTTNFALTGDRAVDYKAVPVLPNNGVNNIYTNDKFKNWIAAPAVITDDGTQKYFQYWSIASTSAVDREIERCYFNAFNYAALDNFVVTPIYDTKKTDISQSGIYTGVTYLETSRNQWNTKADSGKNDKDDSGNRIAADLLYNDFVINFNYKGAQLNLDGTDSAAVKDLGVVVERIQELDIKQDGTKDTDISKYTGIAKDENTVKNIINESITDKRYSKHSIAKKDLDNKNSYMLYDAFYNGAGWNLENQKSAQSYTYKNYVYRVYTYIKYTDENGKAQIVLSEVPGYFTMYDEAVKDYVAPKTSSTNP